jgi:hypothetical protein
VLEAHRIGDAAAQVLSNHGLRSRPGDRLGTALDFTATRMRDTISPIIQMAMVLAVILWWRQPDRPELFPFKKTKARPPRRHRSCPRPKQRVHDATASQFAAAAARIQEPVPVRELASRRRS